MKTIGIIPARFASTRLPGKPLAKILEKPMIQWVYERATKVFEVYVATDDTRIKEAVEKFGGKVLLTNSNHINGTSRCFEAAEQLLEQGLKFDSVVNIQGDEPFVEFETLQTIKNLIEEEHVEVATLCTIVKEPKSLHSDSNVFLVKDIQDKAMYFSRTPIPTVRGAEKKEWLNHHNYLKHIGIYAYKVSALEEYVSLKPTPLEEKEKLEQLRWLENGRSMHVALVNEEGHSVDTESDLELANLIAAKATN